MAVADRPQTALDEEVIENAAIEEALEARHKKNNSLKAVRKQYKEVDDRARALLGEGRSRRQRGRQDRPVPHHQEPRAVAERRIRDRPDVADPHHRGGEQGMNDLEDKVYNATIDVRMGGGGKVSTLTLSLETSHAILTEAWEKFHEARTKLNELADIAVEPEYAHNRVKRLLWETADLKQAIEAIFALTPLGEDDAPDA